MIKSAPVVMKQLVEQGANIVMITLDTLRLDVALASFAAQELPTLQHFFPAGFESRYTNGSFTYAAHHAFFAGFLPTPMTPGIHPRLFALEFSGSETIGPNTAVFANSTSIVGGLAQHGYRTICIGGTGFFNLASPLGRVLPAMFEEAYWQPSFSVTEPTSTEQQVQWALGKLQERQQKFFLFLNVSAIHQPNCHYLADQHTDDLHSHRAALRYVDQALAPLFEALLQYPRTVVLLFSDHGTCYGEDGHVGHRVGHPMVMQVPYAQCVLENTFAGTM
jgi:membrane-anchored protein YejM (alkaline phosphatase superfamily)